MRSFSQLLSLAVAVLALSVEARRTVPVVRGGPASLEAGKTEAEAPVAQTSAGHEGAAPKDGLLTKPRGIRGPVRSDVDGTTDSKISVMLPTGSVETKAVKPVMIANNTSSGEEASDSRLEPETEKESESESGGFVIRSWHLEEFTGMMIFCLFGAFLCAFIPMIFNEQKKWEEKFEGSETFGNYLEYRFTDWFLTVSGAPVIVLVVLSMGLIVVSALLYALLCGGSPSRALFKIFVWAAAASTDANTFGGRIIGVLCTVAGLVILSLLLGIVADAFSSWMTAIKTGQKDIILSDHVVILGYTECTRCLLEELALAAESDGGYTFVLLASGVMTEVEASIKASNIDLKNSRLIIRSGRPFVIRDLMKVAVSTASKVVLLADTSVSREESDAKSIRALLAMKCQNWPLNGQITVQCCAQTNRELLQNIYSDKVEVVVVGDIVAKLMVQTARQPGLAGVFGMMLGFDGDEFYSEEWEDVVGLNFREALFRFPDAVALGVFTEDGECKLNPGFDYEVQKGDRIIVLAEDNDTYEAKDEPYFDYANYQAVARSGGTSPRQHSASGSKDESGSSKALIIGWNDKMATLLQKMDSDAHGHITVEVYSPRKKADREEEIEDIQDRIKQKFKNLSITQLEVEHPNFTSRLELERLNHFQHENIYILADAELEGRTGADEKTVAVLTQLQHIRRGMNASETKMFNRATTMASHFDPVVEMCEDSTKEHLTICGLTNLIHSVSLVAQALAAVTEEPKVNAIYSDLMSQTTNEFDITKFEEFLGPGEQMPTTLCFGEATYRISQSADAILLAWSHQGDGDEIEWVMNPKDKITPREWSPRDRVVVIRRLAQAPEKASTTVKIEEVTPTPRDEVTVK